MGKQARAREARKRMEEEKLVLPKQRRPFPVLWVALGVILIAAVVAVAMSGGGSHKGSSKKLNGFGEVKVSGESLPRFTDTGSDDAVGTAAPHLTGTSATGKPITIGGPSESGEVVVFMAHWCPHCGREIPKLATWLKTHEVPKGVQLLGVATSSSESRPNYPPQTWLKDNGWKQPTLLDDEISSGLSAWGMSSFPAFVVLDKDGKVVHRESSELSIKDFLKLVDQAAAGKPS